MSKYIHEEYTHNMESPQEIVPILISYFDPKSVIDIGCGIGTFLSVFKNNGVNKIVGIEGPWVNKKLLFKNIEEDAFVEADLEKEFLINERFDMALFLEVAEHLKEESSDIFIKNLVSLSDTIIFSAALPNQGGQNHINEQWTSYWQKKFEKHGYSFYDIFREKLWNNSRIDWWYKQNMFLVTNKIDLPEYISSKECRFINNYFHPEIYLKKTNNLLSIIKGKEKLLFYLKLLIKFFKN